MHEKTVKAMHESGMKKIIYQMHELLNNLKFKTSYCTRCKI